MSELNLFGALDGKAKQDVETFWRPIVEQRFPWPKGITLEKTYCSHYIDILDYSGFRLGLFQQNEALKIPLLVRLFSEPKDEDFVSLKVGWNFHVNPDGLLIATPHPFDHWTPTPNMHARAVELIASMGVKTIIRQLPEKLFPFLPSVATRGMEKIDARQTNADARLWGYASDVRAFRAALMDELHKPL